VLLIVIHKVGWVVGVIDINLPRHVVDGQIFQVINVLLQFLEDQLMSLLSVEAVEKLVCLFNFVILYGLDIVAHKHMQVFGIIGV